MGEIQGPQPEIGLDRMARFLMSHRPTTETKAAKIKERKMLEMAKGTKTVNQELGQSSQMTAYQISSLAWLVAYYRSL